MGTEYRSPEDAIRTLIDNGATVRRDEAHRDLVNSGYVATWHDSTFVLKRVGVHYEWKLA